MSEAFETPTLLDLNLEDVEELKVLEDNKEALLRVVRAEITPNKKDPSKFNLALTLDSAEDPLVDDIRVWLPIPDPTKKSEDPKRYTKTVQRFKEFCLAFRVEMPLQVSDLQGKEGWAVVSEEEGLNGQQQNSVRRFVARR